MKSFDGKPSSFDDLEYDCYACVKEREQASN